MRNGEHVKICTKNAPTQGGLLYRNAPPPVRAIELVLLKII